MKRMRAEEYKSMVMGMMVSSHSVDRPVNHLTFFADNETFYFVIVADAQLGCKSFDYSHVNNSAWAIEQLNLANMIRIINTIKANISFVVMTGDHSDQWPQGNKELRSKQIESFQSTVKQNLDESVKILYLCGNHDVGLDPDYDLINEYKQNFGDDYYWFTSHGVLFIVINTSYYFYEPQRVITLAEQQERWLTKIFKTESPKYNNTIVIQHVPWYTKTIDEPSRVYNLPLKLRSHFLDMYVQHGVKYIFAGHNHVNHIIVHNNTIEMVTTAALTCSDTPGYRIVQVAHDKVKHKFFKLNEKPNFEW